MNCAPRTTALFIGTKEIGMGSSKSTTLFKSAPISDAESCLYNIFQYALGDNAVFMFHTSEEGFMYQLYYMRLMRATLRKLS